VLRSQIGLLVLVSIFLLSVFQLLVTGNVVSSSPNFVTLMMEALSSFEEGIHKSQP
jgi:hypothetical protein